MELKDKKINFLGDSITEGYETSGKAQRFTDLIAARHQLAVSRNYGEAGTRVAQQEDDSPTREPVRNPRNFCARACEMDTDADVVVVFGGVNDCSVGVPLGAMADRTVFTFYGALHTLYQILLKRYPAAAIAAATPIHWVEEDSPERHGVTLAAYVQAVRQVAGFYGLPVLNLYESSGLKPGDEKNRAQYMPDGVHPNDAGHVILAEKIAAFLCSL